MKEVLKYINQLKKEINKRLAIDYSIKADPYDNIARMKICEKIEKFILTNNQRRKNNGYIRTI